MQGLDRLLNLPKNIRTEIENVYGSVQYLYQKNFDLNAEAFSLTSSNSPILNQIQAEIYDNEYKLEEFGIIDGSDITTEIASDFGEIIVNKQITKVNEYLSQFGTDFDTMRKWLKNKYNI